MKKLFFLIPALMFAVMANAIAPGTKALFNAYTAAEAGSTIILEEGTYNETDRLVFTKDITIQAAEGAEVIVKPVKDSRIQSGAKVKFVGIKFDGSSMVDADYAYFLRSYDNTEGKEVRFEDCEFSNFDAQFLIHAEGANRTLDSVIVNNCKCINNGKDAIYIAAGSDTQETAKGVIVKNSTFANFSALVHSVIEVDNYGATKTPNIEVTVDHCTFYNNPTSASGYADIRVSKSTKVVISNCIFAHPEAYASRCGTYCYGGTINNCLTYNFQGGSYGHRTDDITPTGCIYDTDPLFTDANNGDFFLKRNYITHEVSPAYNAGTDGSTIGDPRWEAEATYPTTDFADPYVFTPADAVVGAGIEMNYHYGENAPYLRYTGSTPTYAEATWTIKATRACHLSVSVNMADNSWNKSVDTNFKNGNHIFGVEIWNSNNVRIDTVAEGVYGDGTLDGYATYPTVNLGTIEIPEAGVYTVKLLNPRGWAKCGVSNVTFTYIGGAVQDMPGSTDINDAWFSANGTRANGKITYSSIGDGCWAKWNINVATSQWYNVIVDICGQYGHEYTVEFLKEGETTPISVHKGINYTNDLTLYHNDLGLVELEAGNYEMTVSNSIGDAALIGVTLSYGGGNVQNMPGITNINDAWYSPNGTRTSVIDFPNDDIQNGWAKWNVAFANSSNYKVKVKVNTTSGHNYTVKLYRNATDPDPITFANGADYDHKGSPVELEIDPQMVEAGNYIMEVTNGMQNSNAELISVEFIYAGGGTVDLPATLQPMDAALDQWEVVDGKISGTEGNATTGSAVWNVASNGGKYNFKFNYSSDNGHLMKVEIFEEGKSTAKYTWNEPEANHWVTGDFEENLGTFELEDKNYVVKVTNTQSSSHAKITNIVVTYLGGAVVNIPGSLPLADALLSDNAYRNEGATELHFIAPANVSHIADEWAKWNVHVETEGVYEFTLSVVGTNYGIYTLTVDNGASVSKGKSGNGSVTLPPVLLTQGDHVIQIANTNNYADGYLTAVSAATVANTLVLDEMDENMSVISSNTGSHIPALKRTFRTGVYNSICVPFNVNDELTNIFGEGYELLTMISATLEGGVLTLNFAPASTIAYGTPYLIKPTKDVINPVFNAHSVSASTSHLTVEGTDANLVGVLYKQDLGMHPENLYLGADGNLYFSNSDVTIKGFRAYFHVNVSNPQQNVKAARIVKGTQVVTELNLVDAQNEATKVIENGQLVIIKNGVRYNAMGIIIK